MNAPGAAQGKHTGEARELYMAFELGEKNWKLSLSDGAHSPSRYTVVAGDTVALLECIAKAKVRCGLCANTRVLRFYGWCQVHHEKSFESMRQSRATYHRPLLDDVCMGCPGRRGVCKVDAPVRCGTLSPTEAT